MRSPLVSIGIGALIVVASVSSSFAQTPDGSRLYRDNCAACHDAGADRAPSRDALGMMAPEAVLSAMDNGVMVTMASRIGAAERRAVAEFVTGKPFSQPL